MEKCSSYNFILKINSPLIAVLHECFSLKEGFPSMIAWTQWCIDTMVSIKNKARWAFTSCLTSRTATSWRVVHVFTSKSTVWHALCVNCIVWTYGFNFRQIVIRDFGTHKFCPITDTENKVKWQTIRKYKMYICFIQKKNVTGWLWVSLSYKGLWFCTGIQY